MFSTRISPRISPEISYYLFSCFGEIGGMRVYSTIDKYKLTIDSVEGKTHKEKTYNYLISVGVEKTDLDNLIEIMLEKK